MASHTPRTGLAEKTASRPHGNVPFLPHARPRAAPHRLSSKCPILQTCVRAGGPPPGSTPAEPCRLTHSTTRDDVSAAAAGLRIIRRPAATPSPFAVRVSCGSVARTRCGVPPARLCITAQRVKPTRASQPPEPRGVAPVGTSPRSKLTERSFAGRARPCPLCGGMLRLYMPLLAAKSFCPAKNQINDIKHRRLEEPLAGFKTPPLPAVVVIRLACNPPCASPPSPGASALYSRLCAW